MSGRHASPRRAVPRLVLLRHNGGPTRSGLRRQVGQRVDDDRDAGDGFAQTMQALAREHQRSLRFFQGVHLGLRIAAQDSGRTESVTGPSALHRSDHQSEQRCVITHAADAATPRPLSAADFHASMERELRTLLSP